MKTTFTRTQHALGRQAARKITTAMINAVLTVGQVIREQKEDGFLEYVISKAYALANGIHQMFTGFSVIFDPIKQRVITTYYHTHERYKTGHLAGKV